MTGSAARPRLPENWLRDRLRLELPHASDEQIAGLVAIAKDYGDRLREARNADRCTAMLGPGDRCPGIAEPESSLCSWHGQRVSV